MKKTILIIVAIAAITACNKKETTTVDHSADHSEMSAPVDSGAMPEDSLSTSQTSSEATSLNDQDRKFADAAAKGGMMEMMAGKLASQNATNSAVKKLGEMMVKDHTKANEELQQWASKTAYTLPTGLDADQQKAYDDLKAKKGADFDRMYTDMMVKDHEKTIADFKKEAADGYESSLKNFAAKTLPTLDHHLMESKKAKDAVK
ncbi:DUF4142 domain-containing protein [Chryseobacterium sp. G0201]|uniref:DUF4142 domain-containing protein n=1 Tax=Chryseobacterium sp. G0201 TaxID=2487065 RepID=UPI000F4F7AB3|nr:DUF4142 domain-containing protein [Chryseobacterium sp. G0201]AZA53905.1 DUF4142 domain-containing protein [Chryseobacterium sp. G0201]